MSDIILTWPKSRSLESYLREVRRAHSEGLVVNFRVRHAPDVTEGDRCYMVHDGVVRGWMKILGVQESSRVIDPITQRSMSGLFVVREPLWHPMDPPLRRMPGFRGYRYAERLLSS